jgi:hypothetical protein
VSDSEDLGVSWHKFLHPDKTGKDPNSSKVVSRWREEVVGEKDRQTHRHRKRERRQMSAAPRGWMKCKVRTKSIRPQPC